MSLCSSSVLMECMGVGDGGCHCGIRNACDSNPGDELHRDRFQLQMSRYSVTNMAAFGDCSVANAGAESVRVVCGASRSNAAIRTGGAITHSTHLFGE